MSETNWKELAVDEAKQIVREWERARTCRADNWLPDSVVKAQAILALAQPDEQPVKWPGVEGEPHVAGIGNYQVRQFAKGWSICGPTCSTRAEAVAAWNATVRAISGGVDRETASLMFELRLQLVRADSGREVDREMFTRIDAWLAAHAKGGGNA